MRPVLARAGADVECSSRYPDRGVSRVSGVAGQPVCVLYCAAFVWRDRESEMAQGESGDGGRYTGFGGPSTSIKACSRQRGPRPLARSKVDAG